ncbi:hypothetical protein [Methylobacterium planeticum]|uniref:Uncharacterized protein n=1 Tax=Methylobacterium planeticum TaxID=2615211 RepID=A0A6N6MS80_9HYPH|nr:hypothetical protein [Methylobacterium planeticum]KAB1073355.1 hypothetical protein F6X51_11390 [Methylobacterium planeticum]
MLETHADDVESTRRAHDAARGHRACEPEEMAMEQEFRVRARAAADAPRRSIRDRPRIGLRDRSECAAIPNIPVRADVWHLKPDDV